MWVLPVLAQTQPPAGGDFAMKDIPGLLLAIAVGALIIFLTTMREGRSRERRQAKQAPNTGKAHQAAPTHRQELQKEAERSPGVTSAPLQQLSPPHPQRLTASERRHTMLVGSEGEGKTQTQIAFIVGDVANGDQVIWASSNLSLHHSRDQQTDLRPIAHLFEHTRSAMEIMAVLQWASDEVERRMQFYHADQPHGHPIVIHVDELGGLYRAFGDILVNTMRNIAEQGRKVDVFLFLVAHNSLKDATGLDSALKPLFKTRLIGTVDQFTWTALVGPGVKLRGKPNAHGVWHQPDKQGNVFEVPIRRPTAEDIARLALRRSRGFDSILETAQPYRQRLVGELETMASRAGTARPQRVEEADELQPASATAWQPTELHHAVRKLVEAALPDIRRHLAAGQNLAKAQELTETSNRALARRLGLGEKGGSAAMKVRDAIAEWEEQGGVRLFDVPQLPPQDGRFESTGGTPERGTLVA